MNVLGYALLRFSGFNADVARALTLRESEVPFGTAHKLGPARLATPYDVEDLRQGLKSSPFGVRGAVEMLEKIAQAKPFTIHDLVMLVSAHHSHKTFEHLGQGISLNDLVGYEAAGLTSAGQIVSAFQKGLTKGSEVHDYLKQGINRWEAMAVLQGSHVSPEAVGAFKQSGVTDHDQMIKITMQYGITGKTFNRYRIAGVTEPKVIRALMAVGVTSEDATSYRASGFDKPEDMILLNTHKVGPYAARMFADAGFGGDAAAVVSLVNAGFSPNPHELQMKLMEKYASAGLAGSADAMIELRKARVPGDFVLARSLLNGKFDNPLDFARALVSEYGGKRATQTATPTAAA